MAVGALLENKELNLEALKKFKEASKNLDFVLHMAFDEVTDLEKSYEVTKLLNFLGN